MNDLFEKPDLSTLTDRQLLESIYTMLCHNPVKKTPHKAIQGVPKRRHIYDPDFETLWKSYPARNGSNPKWKAEQCWKASLKESDSPGNEVRYMMEGTQRYAAWCHATNKTGTEMAMQTTRFLGTGREYENHWAIPEPEVIKIPTEINALVEFANARGITARPGESTYDFRQRVENAIQYKNTSDTCCIAGTYMYNSTYVKRNSTNQPDISKYQLF